MKNRGLLLEVRGDRGIVMTPDGRFESVPVASGDRVGDEIQFSPVTGAVVRGKWLTARAIAAALIIGLMIAFVGEAIRVQNTAVAYVEVDINPAIELGIDRYNRVVSVEGLDDDGRDVVAGLDLKRLDLEQALTRVAGAAEEKGYVKPETEDTTVVITVTPARGSSVDEKTKQRVEAAREAVSRMLESKNVRGTVQVIHTAPEVREEARKLNVPPGHLALILKAKEQGIDVLKEVEKYAEEDEEQDKKPGERQGGRRSEAGEDGRDDEREDEHEDEREDRSRTGRESVQGDDKTPGGERDGRRGEEDETARPGRQPGKAGSTGDPGPRAGVKDGETIQGGARDAGREDGEDREDRSARILEEIIERAKEEKDWRGLIEKFGGDIGRRLKSATPPGQSDKKDRGQAGDSGDGDRMTPGEEESEGDNASGRPGMSGPQAPAKDRRAGGESVWDRWRRGLKRTGARDD